VCGSGYWNLQVIECWLPDRVKKLFGCSGLESFNLVIVDYWMPGMNGIVTARQLKKINSSVPIIILSGLSQLPDETIGVAERWILKDEGPEYLLSAIRALLKAAS
jgi:DNA-binding response OmpR family regulator